jgi:dephospho-CoA kinase
MLKIGLTGGIGSGKSTVSKLFQDLAVPVIDADMIAHQLVESGQPALALLKRTFPNIINENGSLNREKLRDIVFSDPSKKRKLENILHPLVYARIESEIRKLNSHYCILAIPLLLETDMTSLVDRVLVIDCTVETQLERVRKRDGLSKQRISSIIASQISREKRLSHADDIIENSKSASQLAEQVKKLHNLYISINKS